MRRLLIIAVAMIPVAAAAAAAPLPTTLTKLCGGLPYVKGDVVQFHASDGARLVGAIAGPKGGRVGVVFANTADGEICDWVSLFGDEKIINGLAAAGDQVLLFDFRGTGHSGKVSGPGSGAFDRDVLAGAAELRSRGARRTVLVGGSFGGNVSLVAATELNPPPAAFVGLSASGLSTGTFGDPAATAAARKLRVPMLFVVAHDDVLGETKGYYQAAGSKEKELFVVPGSAHAYFESDASGPKVLARVVSFIRAHTKGAFF